MSTRPERIAAVELFEEIKRQTKAEDTACALLVVADTLDQLKNKYSSHLFTIGGLSHEICLGVRAALFGTEDSGMSATIGVAVADAAADIARAIRDHAPE